MRRKNSKKRPETDHLTQKPVRRGHKSSIASGKGKTAFQDRNKSGQKFSAQNTSAMPNAVRSFQKGLLLYGVHAVIAALNNPERQNQHLYITKAGLEQLQKQQQNKQPSEIGLPEISLMERSALDQLLKSGGVDPQHAVHQGFVLHTRPLQISDLDEWLFIQGQKQAQCPENKALRLIILDQVTDPRNIGAILRSARAFCADGIVLTDKHAPEESGALAKAATGALEHIPLIRVINLARTMEKLKEQDFTLIGLEAGGSHTLEDFARENKLALIFGSEGDGMRRLTRQGCDHLVSIPISDAAESLNVSVAAAIALYATRPVTKRQN